VITNGIPVSGIGYPRCVRSANLPTGIKRGAKMPTIEDFMAHKVQPLTEAERARWQKSIETTLSLMPNRDLSDKALIYFIKQDNIVKIGQSNTILNRLPALEKIYGGFDLILLMPGNLRYEFAIHLKFNKHLVKENEWFYLSDEVMGFIKENSTEENCKLTERVAGLLGFESWGLEC
jgi:hypothetical protein